MTVLGQKCSAGAYLRVLGDVVERLRAFEGERRVLLGVEVHVGVHLGVAI